MFYVSIRTFRRKNITFWKICKLLQHFRTLSKQFLALCQKIFVRSVKTGFYVSKGPIWSKKTLFENCSIFETSSYLGQQDFIFCLKVFGGVVKAPLHVSVRASREKQKLSLKKAFSIFFEPWLKNFWFPFGRKSYDYQKCNFRIPRTNLKRKTFFWKIYGVRNTFGPRAKTFQPFVD